MGGGGNLASHVGRIAMAMSQDSDLTALQPDILEFGISAFTSEHARAQADVERELRFKWWPMRGISGELDASLLTESQFTRAASYRVLGWYALPKLTKWETLGAEDRFQQMMGYYRSSYEDEIDLIIKDGVEYDADDDSTVALSEKKPMLFGRLVR